MIECAFVQVQHYILFFNPKPFFPARLTPVTVAVFPVSRDRPQPPWDHSVPSALFFDRETFFGS